MTNVFWVTGLSGAGKTTIGNLLYQHLKQTRPTIFLDGDIIREVLGNMIGYTKEERYKGAFIISRMCQMLASQNIDVVCCTISMFHDVRKRNRKNIPGYREIYLKVKPEVLYQRDQKGLYSGVKNGKLCNVMGMDLEFEEPKCPDLIVENNGDASPEQILEQILSDLNL